MNTKKLVATIINGKPAKKDAFKGGGHNRSAQALVDTIIQLADRDGAIGLEGDWGAGKSTVVQLAEDQLIKADKSHEYKVFTFDLWSHQSDNFRRAFLEDFVSWVEQKKLLDSARIKVVRNKIRDRVKTTDTKNTSQYSLAGLLIFLGIPVLPILYSWIQLPDLIITETNGATHFEFAWKKIVSIIAFIVGYAFIGLRVRKEFNQGKKSSTEYSWLDAFSKAVDLFQRRSERDRTTQNIRDEDPTTVEFYNIFRNDILSVIQKDRCRIVFVLDNIDRLPSDMVKNIWAEVRSIFSNSPLKLSDSETAWVTAIVPYARDVIEHAIGNSDNVEQQTAQLVNKTFDRVIRVSPPIGSDWREYFFKQFKEVIKPALDKNTLHNLYKLLEIHLTLTAQRATPRHVISYINEFGALWVQWGNELLPESLALWVLTRDEYESDPNKLLLISSMNPRYTAILETDVWQRELAALAFNVAPKNAEEVLFTQPLEAALVSSDSAKLKDISENPAFGTKIEEVLSNRANEWAEDSPELFGNAARNLNEISIPSSIQRTTWIQLSRAISNLSNAHPINSNTLNNLAKIIANQTDKEIANSVACQLFTYVPDAETFAEDWELDLSSSSEWLDAVVSLRDSLAKVDESTANSFIKTCNIPNNQRIFVSVAIACAQSEEINFEDFEPKISSMELHEPLASLIVDNPTYATEAMYQLYPVDNAIDGNIDTLVSAIGTKLRQPKLNTNDTISLVNALYFLWSKNKKASSAVLEQLVSDGTLIFRANQLQISEAEDEFAYSMFLYVEYLNSGESITTAPSHPTLGDITAQLTWYKNLTEGTEPLEGLSAKLASLVSTNDQFSEWMDYALGEPETSNFYKQILRQLVEQGAYNRLNVQKIVSKYDQIKSVLGQKLTQKLLKKYENWSVHFTEYFSGENTHQIPNSFINDVSPTAKQTKFGVILNCIDNYLRDLKRGDWIEAAKNSTDDRLRLASQRPSSIAGEAFIEGVGELLKNVLTGKETRNQDSDFYLYSFVNAAKAQTANAISKDLLRKMSIVDISTTGAVNLILFYKPVVERINFMQLPNNTLLFFSKLIESSNDEVHQYIKSNSKELTQCMNKATDGSDGRIIETIDALAKHEDLKIQKWGKQLISSLKIKSKMGRIDTNNGHSD